MFIHLGGDVITKLSDVIMIINSENALGEGTNRQFVANAKQKRAMKIIDPVNTKSIVVTDKMVYLSPISSQTLKKRADFIDNIE